MFLSQKSTLIPDSYFDKNLLKSYFEFNHPLDALDEIHYNYIPSVDAYNVFTLHNYIATAISNQFKGVRFYHQAMPFIEKVLEYSTPIRRSCGHRLYHHFFDIMISSGDRLKFYNTFQYNGPSDVLYFILFICKQFNINPRQLEIIALGRT